MTTEPTRTPRSAEDAPRNQPLARALAGASIGGDRHDAYRALLPGPVLVPTAPRGGEPPGMPPLLAVQLPRGGPALLGFTSVEALREWSGRIRSFTVMSGAELSHQARAARAVGVVIDAGSAHEMQLEPFELDQLADGLTPLPPGEVHGQLTHATRRIRPSTARWPESAEEAVRAAAGRDGVEQAYLFDIAYNDGEPQPAVGVRFGAAASPGTVDAVMTELAGRLQERLPADVRVDLVVLDDSLHEAVRDLVAPLG